MHTSIDILRVSYERNAYNEIVGTHCITTNNKMSRKAFRMGTIDCVLIYILK